MRRLIIYSKPGCHLCEDMKTVVAGVLSGLGQAPVEEIDITSDPALRERYELEIPVLTLDGRKIAKYRITEAELVRALKT